MKKRFIAPYFVCLILGGSFWSLYAVYQFFARGFLLGCSITALSLSLWVLCIPLAHGRLVVGGTVRLVLGKQLFPEIFIWLLAVALNIIAMVLMPEVYQESVITYLLYRIITVPNHWMILVVGALGAWSRFFIGAQRYAAREALYTLIRHLFSLVGFGIFFYLVRYDLVAIMNALANG